MSYMQKRKELGFSDSDSDSDEGSVPKSKKRSITLVDPSPPPSESTDPQASPLDTVRPQPSAIRKEKMPAQSPLSPSDPSSSLMTSPAISLSPARSQSIVIPDEPPSDAASPKSTRQPPVVINLDDFDPDLLDMGPPASSSPQPSSASPAEPKRIAVRLYFINLKPVKNDDPGVQQVLTLLSKPMKFYLFQSDTFAKMLEIFSQKKCMRMEELVLVYNKSAVVLRATPSSLLMDPNQENRMEVYLRRDFENKVENDRQERAARLLRMEQENSDDYVFDATDQDDMEPAESEEGLIHVKLRGKDNKDIGLRVKPSTTVQSMVKQYLVLLKLDEGLADKVQLSFEGEKLDPASTVEDTDLEDQDMLSVIMH
ncbi:hypothetical protein DM01DRAFT_1331590 [Hesseltinella vesiculosa]|uniref:Ubiquitin-like domain-containing protein n=1 Tax=Hesseltinella vesiculosa TaxID=101127 RepID=A0A1X2GVT1_9FUNG|nr:hypothetical protein DM01DRAFT_1331590 [Hesseltinella vesiculosa]